jgi:hypothetical protein
MLLGNHGLQVRNPRIEMNLVRLWPNQRTLRERHRIYGPSGIFFDPEGPHEEGCVHENRPAMKTMSKRLLDRARPPPIRKLELRLGQQRSVVYTTTQTYMLARTDPKSQERHKTQRSMKYLAGTYLRPNPNIKVFLSSRTRPLSSSHLLGSNFSGSDQTSGSRAMDLYRTTIKSIYRYVSRHAPVTSDNHRASRYHIVLLQCSIRTNISWIES